MARRIAESVEQEAKNALQDAESKRKENLEIYRAEDKVPMYLSPMYRAYFGNVMTVSINGISIYFKVDGTTQMVPQTYADEIASRRMGIDKMLARHSRLSNVSANHESAPGELALL